MSVHQWDVVMYLLNYQIKLSFLYSPVSFSVLYLYELHEK